MLWVGRWWTGSTAHVSSRGTASGQGRSRTSAALVRPASSGDPVPLGGDKTGEWNDWSEWAVPLADDLYDEYQRRSVRKD